MGYSVSQSLISSQPPLFVFTICLTAFGFTMIVLAYVVGEKEMPNPDVKMDWNRYFKKVSNLRLCPVRNFTSGGTKISETFLSSMSALNSSSSHVVDESKSMSAVLSGVVDLAMEGDWQESMFVNTSVSAKFRIRGELPTDFSLHLKGQIKGYLLGFSGKFGRLLYNVSLNIHPLQKNNCTGKNCWFDYEICITMSWPSELLPKTKGPEKCTISQPQNSLPIFFAESPLLEEKDESSKTCIELSYSPDVKLTEMLSLHERSIVNLHLMHTSYFMFVMVMTLVCYSLIRGRFRHPKNYVSLQKVLEA
ncbi:transmembrane protein 248 [Parasteatoda tepidariorum]|uniref:TMEM248/TMEM219 domain-containing protein n=1 Tax=Parasteatoda tepidariorum TaxID=114398 RepID=A0A2L2XXF1_PARTP|nr:transmembrane protein 248 [Parasteatoda tepidariorum]XP_042905815.1 transmembrane protein 248 [Parasteatoda tepidariorum]XP_042905816.1 transmembrane protein 248 [Parasteatoda tepidariorum]XP_042905817.1 transmembrane protein 248 [Parasteatoda tepidariorum]